MIKNHLQMLRRYLAWRRGQASPNIPPDRIYIETTNRCNLKCPQCPTGLDITNRPKGDIDPKLLQNIVDEISPWSKTAILHIWGEPLLNENLESMISYTARRGMKTEISSNAMLLDESRARSILRSGLSRIYLCIDGVDEQAYSKIRVGGDFNIVKANIERMISLNLEQNRPLEIMVQLINIDITRGQIDEFRRIWTRPGVTGVNIKAFDSWGNRVDSINDMNRSGENTKTPIKRYQCPNLWYHAHIFYDGTLVCCDRDFDLSNPLGNVAGGVLKIWRGEKIKALRRAHMSGEINSSPCKDCKEWAWWKPGLFSSWGNAPKD